MKVINSYGVAIEYNAAENLMEQYICDMINADTEQEFFDSYASLHEAIYGEEWELDKANPVW